MSAYSIFPSLTLRRFAAMAVLPLGLAAASAGAAENPFVAGKIEVKEIKGSDFCNYMILEQMWATKDHISGYWRIRTATLEASGKLDIVAKKGKIVADMWGTGSEKSVESTKSVGPDLHVNVELNWISDVWSSDSGFCIVDFVLPDVIPQTKVAGSDSKKLAEEKSALARLRQEQRIEADRLAQLKAETGRRFAEEEARLAKQRAAEETRLAMLREEQRKEVEKLTKLKAEAEQRLAREEARRADLEARSQDADRLAKQRAEEEAHLTLLREDQRKEADRLARLKAEAEQRLAQGESLDADFERKLRDAERLAELQTKEAARLAKLRQEQGKEAERLLKLKAEAEQRLAKEEARLASLRQEQRKEAERLAKLRAESEERARQFAALAEKQALARKKAERSPTAGINFGDYQALVIGIADYKYLPKLQTAVNDAKAVARTLKEDYGFKVNLMIDPDRLAIIDALDEYRETLGPDDNLLIYYAGHGWLDEDADRGYWLPVDAKPKRRGRWVSNATITDTLKALAAKHVMLVADSCYSGTLVRGVDMEERKREGDYWKRMASKWARVAITSGGLEPVADKGGGKNSPFAKAFLDALGDNDLIMDGTQLFTKLRRPVIVAANQTPQYADVRQAGHDGGDFLFVRKKR